MQYIYLYKYKCVWIYGLYNMNMDIFNEYVYIYIPGQSLRRIIFDFRVRA